jgi:hypothetical protein
MATASIISWTGTAESQLMNILWFVTGASLLAALVAWRQSRRNAKRLEQLSQMYWELKYQHGELRVQLQRVLPSAALSRLQPGEETAANPVPAPREPRLPDGFVPLTSIRR